MLFICADERTARYLKMETCGDPVCEGATWVRVSPEGLAQIRVDNYLLQKLVKFKSPIPPGLYRVTRGGVVVARDVAELLLGSQVVKEG